MKSDFAICTAQCNLESNNTQDTFQKKNYHFICSRHLKDKPFAPKMGDDEDKETARSIAKAQGLQFHCIPTERCGAINVYVQVCTIFVILGLIFN